MNPFDDISETLKSNHLYPTYVTDEKGNVESLEIFAPALQGESRLALVKSLIGDGFRCEFFPNEEIIRVEIKKK